MELVRRQLQAYGAGFSSISAMLGTPRACLTKPLSGSTHADLRTLIMKRRADMLQPLLLR